MISIQPIKFIPISTYEFKTEEETMNGSWLASDDIFHIRIYFIEVVFLLSFLYSASEEM